ncbi:MAG TPA: DUF1798 family protein [Bacillota bacterium]
MDLKEQTNKLAQHLVYLKEIYETYEPPKNKRDSQFFSNVKKQTEPVFHLLVEWEAKALQTIQTNEVHVHPQQIVSTKENMELILMHSFYKDVKRKRYMELIQSVQFILDQLRRSL